MGKLFAFTGAMSGLVLLVVFGPILGALVGAWAGWAVGFVFDETFAAFLIHFGMGAFSPWQIGAGLGFVGNLLKTSVSISKSED